MLRRILLAATLVFGLAPALAQAPPAVPALPDAQRATSYSITASTCACAVGFALYGDGTDYDNWIQVLVNGVRYLSTNPTFGWQLTSPSGPIGGIALPITDAVLTFNQVESGTIQIIGARRPRRLSQFPENRGVAARDLNVALTDIVAQNRENWDRVNGALNQLTNMTVLYASSFGVVGDGITNNDTAISNLLAAISSNGAIVFFPCGTVVVTAPVVLHTKGIYKGCGINDDDAGFPHSYSGTAIQTTSASNDVVDITDIGITLEDIALTSSVAAGSRTGAGLKIIAGGNITTGVNWVYIHRVKAYGHKYGFWEQVPNVEFNHVYAANNNSHGIYFDGSAAAVSPIGASEVVCYECNSGGNTGAGIYLLGPVTGAQFIHPVLTSNTGGALVLKSGGSAPLAVNDVYLTQPEISTNTGPGIDVTSNNGGIGLTVVGGLLEQNAGGGILCGNGFAYVSITGMEGFNNGSAWLLANCSQATYSDLIIGASTTAGASGIEIGANSNEQSFSNIIMTLANTSGGATFAQAVKYDVGANKVVMSNIDITQAPTATSGTLPVNSIITNSPLLAPVPTVNTCAGFSLNAGSGDWNGTVNMTSGTSCAINFGHTFGINPMCTITPNSALSTTRVTATTTVLTATFGSAQTQFSYQCWGY
jgi:hypothetical protein